MTRISYRLNLTKKKDGLWNTKCPYGCDDNNNKKRFFFVDKGKFILAYCHDCGYSSNLRTFIKDKFSEMTDEYKMWGMRAKDKTIAEKAIEAIESVQTAQPIEKEIPTYVKTSRFNELTIDPNMLVDRHPAKQYIQKRQIPFNVVRYTKNFYELTKHLYQDEVFNNYPIPALLIPFYRANEHIEIFQARFFDPKVKPKYLTVKLNQEAVKIYNEDYINAEEIVWIVEGPIDSMFTQNAVALGGSDGQGIWPKQVWVLDNDKGNQQIYAKIKKKIQQGEKVVIWKVTDKFNDINDAIVNHGIMQEDIVPMLKQRTFSGLKARLEFAKLRK